MSPTFPTLLWTENTARALEAQAGHGGLIQATAVQGPDGPYIAVQDVNVGGWYAVRARDVEAAGPACLADYGAFCELVQALSENEAGELQVIADALGEPVRTVGGTVYACIQQITRAAEGALSDADREALSVKRLASGEVQVGFALGEDEDAEVADRAVSVELDPAMGKLGLQPKGGHLDEVGSYHLYA